MRKVIFIIPFAILLILSHNVRAQQTHVPNGGFETWTDSITCQDWNGKLSALYGLLNVNFLTRTTDKYTGTYAARVETKNVSVYGVLDLGNIGLTTLGKISYGLSGLSISGGKPITSNPTHLKGYFKYNNVQDDTMAIIVYLYNRNTVTNKLDTIAKGNFNTNTLTPTYTPFSINLEYARSVETLDSFNIILNSSAGLLPQQGSILYVDELSFDYNNASVEDISADSFVDVYPNPAKDFITVDINSPDCTSLRLVNALGQEVYHYDYVMQKEVIDVSKMPEGIYFVEIKINNDYVSREVVVNK